MTNDSENESLYPNRGRATRPTGISRRRLLSGSMAVSGAMTTGCTGSRSHSGDVERTDETIFVFNTGDKTVSIIDTASDEVLATPYLGVIASFSSNQFAPPLTDTPTNPLWLNVDRGVQAAFSSY